jgi:hypothetical protein
MRTYYPQNKTTHFAHTDPHKSSLPPSKLQLIEEKPLARRTHMELHGSEDQKRWAFSGTLVPKSVYPSPKD